MSVEKLSSGRGYKVRWRDSAGRSRRKTVTLWRDAVKLDGEMKRKKQMGELIAHEKGQITLDDFWEVWWQNYAMTTLSPRTRDVYTRLWRKHISKAVGSRSLAQVRQEDVQRLTALLSGTLKPASVRGVLSVASSVFRCAVQWEYLAMNPCRGVSKPRLQPSRGRALTMSQLSRLSSELTLRSRCVVSLLASTGLRPCELRSLTWGDLTKEAISVYASKTNRQRTVTLRDEARAALLEWYMASGQPSDTALVFPSVAGGPWTDNGWRLWTRQTFKPAALRAGLGDIRPYDLRHTFATTLIYEGRPVHEVARQLGHSPEVCMRTYLHEFESVPSECPANLDRGENFRARLGI